jgi:reverse gyrase
MSELKEEQRFCEYRNCGGDMSHKKVQAKYCSRSCKSSENKYNEREDNRIIKERTQIKDMLEMMRGLSDDGIQKLIELEKIMKK